MSCASLVKVCGVTRESEVDALALLGVGYCGLVVGMDVSYALTIGRAATLATYAGNRLRATIVTNERSTEKLVALVNDINAPAIQLSGFVSARRVSRLRNLFGRPQLTIMQVIHFQGERAAEQAHIQKYVDAGVDYLIIDKVGNDGALGSTGGTIDTNALVSFRDQYNGTLPLLIAGGVNAANAKQLMTASGAVGVDVFSSVRGGDGVDIDQVRLLTESLT